MAPPSKQLLSMFSWQRGPSCPGVFSFLTASTSHSECHSHVFFIHSRVSRVCVRESVFVSVSETGWDRKCNHFSITTSPKVIDVMFTGTATCRAKTCRILISGSGTIQLRSKGAPQAVTRQLCALGDWRGLCRTDIQSWVFAVRVQSRRLSRQAMAIVLLWSIGALKEYINVYWVNLLDNFINKPFYLWQCSFIFSHEIF